MNLSRDERLAALLDGTCSEAEREELLAELAVDDDELEVFAAAAAALSLHEREEVAAGVVPLHTPPSVQRAVGRPRWRPPRRWVSLAAAAGIAAVLMFGILRRGEASGVAQTVAMLSDSNLSLPAGIALAREPVRGSPSDGESVSLGALLVDLEVAARAKDQAQEQRAAAEIAALLRRTNPSLEVIAQYESIGTAGIPRDRLDPELAERAEQAARQPNKVHLGEWLQAARIAASHHDRGFFEAGESQDRLNGKGMPPGVSLRRARAAMPAPGEDGQREPDWATLQHELTSLLNGLSH